jgi:hypothetical protein
MHIFINTYSGKTITLRVKSSDNINSIKKKLYIKNNVYPDYQRLVFEGFSLENSKTLKYYNIKKNATIHLNIRLIGGIPVADALVAAALLTTSGIEVATDTIQETVTRTGWWADFMNKKSEFMIKFANKKSQFMIVLSRGAFYFANFMRALFQFFVIIIVARIIVGFFTKPLEFIMLGFSCIILSIVYVIYYIFYIPPFIWIPFILWFLIFSILPWIVYCVVMLGIFIIISLLCLLLAFINVITGGSIKSLVLCQNHVASWYKTPNFHLKNKFERGILCSRQCFTGYAPDVTGMFCIKIPQGNPSYCPQAEAMRMYTSSRNDLTYYYKDYITTGNMKYITSSPSVREGLLKTHYLQKKDFLEKCEKSMSTYNYMPLNICASLDTIEKNRVNGIDKKTIDRLKVVCNQAYCNSKTNFPFCSQLALGEEDDGSLFWKKLMKILISIAVFIFIIIFVLNYMSKSFMD